MASWNLMSVLMSDVTVSLKWLTVTTPTTHTTSTSFPHLNNTTSTTLPQLLFCHTNEAYHIDLFSTPQQYHVNLFATVTFFASPTKHATSTSVPCLNSTTSATLPQLPACITKQAHNANLCSTPQSCHINPLPLRYSK